MNTFLYPQGFMNFVNLIPFRPSKILVAKTTYRIPTPLRWRLHQNQGTNHNLAPNPAYPATNNTRTITVLSYGHEDTDPQLPREQEAKLSIQPPTSESTNSLNHVSISVNLTATSVFSLAHHQDCSITILRAPARTIEFL